VCRLGCRGLESRGGELHGAHRWRREYSRHLGELWALEAAGEELRRGEAWQAFNKLFLAWKGAVAAVAAGLAGSPGGGRAVEALSNMSPSPLQDGRIVVTASNAPKILYRLLALCREEGCQPGAAEALEELWAERSTAYQLHNAYYEGPEHAGFIDAEEAVDTARKLIAMLRRLYEQLSTGNTILGAPAAAETARPP